MKLYKNISTATISAHLNQNPKIKGLEKAGLEVNIHPGQAAELPECDYVAGLVGQGYLEEQEETKKSDNLK